MCMNNVFPAVTPQSIHGSHLPKLTYREHVCYIVLSQIIVILLLNLPTERLANNTRDANTVKCKMTIYMLQKASYVKIQMISGSQIALLVKFNSHNYFYDQNFKRTHQTLLWIHPFSLDQLNPPCK